MNRHRAMIAESAIAILSSGLIVVAILFGTRSTTAAIIAGFATLGLAALPIIRSQRSRGRMARVLSEQRSFRNQTEIAFSRVVWRQENVANTPTISRLNAVDRNLTNELKKTPMIAPGSHEAAQSAQYPPAHEKSPQKPPPPKSAGVVTSGTLTSPLESPKPALNNTKPPQEVKPPHRPPAPRAPVHPIVGLAKEKWIESRQIDTATINLRDYDSASYRVSQAPYSDEIPVAIIADDFTFESFRHEFDTERLTPSNWRAVMEKHQPRLFLCESAWQGGPPAVHPWQGKVYTSIRFEKENRKDLLEILEYCRRRNIPTVFWNKEDPVHFSDRINDFVRTAALFDYVFTTADECVPLYKRDVGVENVGALPFAVQPKLFNPIGAYGQNDDVNFAGTWYQRYPDRAAAAKQILDHVLEASKGLVIYDRMYSSPSPAYNFPAEYEQFTRPSIPYPDTADAYRKSRFGITLNTVTNSRTMFARRVFELAASGSIVISNSALGVKEFFGESVIYGDTASNPLLEFSDEELRAKQREAMSIAFNNTYRHRAETILSMVGIEYASITGKMQLVGIVRNLSDVQELIEYRDSQYDAIGSILFVVSEDANPQLEFDVAIESESIDYATVSMTAIKRGDYRDRNLFRSRTVIFCDPRRPALSRSEVQLLKGFGTALDQPVTVSDDASSRYRFGRLHDAHGVVAQSHRAQQILAATDPFTVFKV